MCKCEKVYLFIYLYTFGYSWLNLFQIKNKICIHHTFFSYHILLARHIPIISLVRFKFSKFMSHKMYFSGSFYLSHARKNTNMSMVCLYLDCYSEEKFNSYWEICESRKYFNQAMEGHSKCPFMVCTFLYIILWLNQSFIVKPVDEFHQLGLYNHNAVYHCILIVCQEHWCLLSTYP
jgi:hypothetical protein